MVQRTPLIQQLTQAWKKTIKGAYNNRLINSERGLQTYFCAALLKEFRKAQKQNNRRLFIEPHLPDIKGIDEGCYPDVVICNTQQIIGVVELKYLPRTRPGKGTEKDIETLAAIASKSGVIKLANDRYRGTSNSSNYTLAKDAVLCWAGVYTGKSCELTIELGSDNQQTFLQLDAITKDGEDPIIRVG